MSEVNILDNFLDEEQYLNLYNQISGSNFPWYYNDDIVYSDVDNDTENIWKFQFTHKFYENNFPNSDLIEIVFPLIEKIKPKALLRIKANMGLINLKNIYGGFHVDYNFKCKTGIYYLNTNNGYTELEDGTKIDSVKNRFVYFDSDIGHSGVSQTDTQTRMVININYFD